MVVCDELMLLQHKYQLRILFTDTSETARHMSKHF